MFAESLMAEIVDTAEEICAERTLFSLTAEVECPTGDPDETFADDISIHLHKKHIPSYPKFLMLGYICQEKFFCVTPHLNPDGWTVLLF